MHGPACMQVASVQDSHWTETQPHAADQLMGLVRLTMPCCLHGYTTPATYTSYLPPIKKYK